MDFQKRLGHIFKNKNLLEQALTHSSYANENKLDPFLNNERLEFLGDAVLEIVVSEFLYLSFPKMSEGELTRLRASIVCEPSLVKKAKALLLGENLRLGRGEEHTGGRKRGSILADAFEAVIGAIYLDGGYESAKAFIVGIIADDADEMRSALKTSDCKTSLQEAVQKNSKEPVVYHIVGESGPDHDKLFIAQAVHMSRVLGQGSGKSKKEAEQNAALNALNNTK